MPIPGSRHLLAVTLISQFRVIIKANSFHHTLTAREEVKTNKIQLFLHRGGMGEDTSLNLSLFLIPVNKKISFLTNSEFMGIERGKLWIP